MDQGSMTVSRRALLGLPALGLLGALGAGPAAADEASGWFQGLHSRVRLLAGGSDESGRALLAGIAFELDPGFKTYWRTPGESGLPPAFDWSGSENLASAEVLWPAPGRFDDQGGVAYGYKDRVLLPLRIVAADPSRPVRMRLKLDYGVCKDICIPASARLGLRLGTEAGAHRRLVEEALARVPKRQPVGAVGNLSVLAVEPSNSAGKAAMEVVVRAPPAATLFVEAPEGWYLAAGPLQPLASRQDDASGRFVLEILERPREHVGPLDLRLTLVAGDRGIETRASLDSARLPR
jgi:DsbC/DsbD-like thiol-disulfide interchange protein